MHYVSPYQFLMAHSLHGFFRYWDSPKNETTFLYNFFHLKSKSQAKTKAIIATFPFFEKPTILSLLPFCIHIVMHYAISSEGQQHSLDQLQNFIPSKKCQSCSVGRVRSTSQDREREVHLLLWDKPISPFNTLSRKC